MLHCHSLGRTAIVPWPRDSATSAGVLFDDVPVPARLEDRDLRAVNPGHFRLVDALPQVLRSAFTNIRARVMGMIRNDRQRRISVAPLPGYVSNYMLRATARVPAYSSRSPGVIIRQFAGSFRVAFEMNVLRLKR